MATRYMQGGVFSAFSEYPMTQRFHNVNLSPLILLCTILTFAGLSVWNVLTQGYNKVTESLLLDTFVTNSSTTCQKSTILVGQPLFTIEEAGAPLSGAFQWAVNSVARVQSSGQTETGFQYTGGRSSCNISSVAVTYQFGVQSYVYGICAQCIVPSGNDTSRYVGLCSNYDISTANLPNFTRADQQTLQNRIYGLATPYPRLNFAAGSLPAEIFPPYQNASNPLVNTTITPADAMQMSVWLAGMSYYTNSSDPLANGTTLITGDASATPHTMEEAFTITSPPSGLMSGLTLSINGLGSLQPTYVPGGNISTLPAPIVTLYNYSLVTMKMMANTAVQDLDGRAFGATYLCNVNHKEIKDALNLLALVLGNSVGVCTAVLTIFIFLGKAWDDEWLKRHAAHVIVQQNMAPATSASSDSHKDLERGFPAAPELKKMENTTPAA